MLLFTLRGNQNIINKYKNNKYNKDLGIPFIKLMNVSNTLVNLKDITKNL